MKDSHPYLLKIAWAFLLILFTATEGLAQLSKKDDRTFRKSEKLFMHDKPNEAIRKSEPVLNRNPAEAKLWMAMIKYHVSRYMNFIDADTTRGQNSQSFPSIEQQVDQMLYQIFRIYYYQEMVNLLEDMNKKCRQNEIICEYIEQLRALGQESIRTGEKVTSIFGVHQMTINTIEIKRCRKPPPDLNKEIVE